MDGVKEGVGVCVQRVAVCVRPKMLCCVAAIRVAATCAPTVSTISVWRKRAMAVWAMAVLVPGKSGVGESVSVGVKLGVKVGVLVAVGVFDGVKVNVGVKVGVSVWVAVSVRVGVSVRVTVSVGTAATPNAVGLADATTTA